MVQTIEGNIFDSKCEVIACQVNCVGIMTSGFSPFVKQKYPEVYEEYRKVCATSSQDNNLLGTCTDVKTNDGKIVCLMFCQDGFNGAGRYTDYPSFKSCMEYVRDVHGDKKIAMPYKIGCKPFDKRESDWILIYKFIENLFKDNNVTIYKRKDQENK